MTKTIIPKFMTGANHDQTDGFGQISYAELCQIIKQPPRPANQYANTKELKKQLPFIAPYIAPSKRKADVLKSDCFTAIVVDDDSGANSLESLKASIVKLFGDVAFSIYSTASSTENERRYRCVVPLARSCSFEVLRPLQLALVDAIGADDCTSRPAQIAYQPVLIAHYENYINEHDRYFNTDDNCPLVQAAKLISEQLQAEEKAEKKFKAERKKLIDKQQKGEQLSVIDKYNQSYEIEALLREFQYRKIGRKWLAPDSGSGTPGIVILESGLAYSHHSSTAIRGCFDQFELFKVHRHGADLKAALRSAGELLKTADGVSVTEHNQEIYRQEQAAIETNLKASDEVAQPWQGVAVPTGYRVTPRGVLTKVDKDWQHITMTPVWVESLLREKTAVNYSLGLRFIDRDGQLRDYCLPVSLLHTAGTDAAQKLAALGVAIKFGRERSLLEFISEFNPDKKITTATALGWHDDAFVLPTMTINPSIEPIEYRPKTPSPIAAVIEQKGDLNAWQKGLSNSSSLVRFAVQAAIAAPMRHLVGVEAGGFHFFGLTSQGKTTLLQAAASVWASGADPAIAGGKQSYLQKWNSTSNALESKAELLNDLPLIVDEIGESDAREFGGVIYKLFAGVGRGRSNRDGDLKEPKSWRCSLLSAGELGVIDHIAHGKGDARGGMMVRLPDLRIDECEPLFKSSEEADRIKQLCADHYGHVGALAVEQMHQWALGWRDFNHDCLGEAVTSIHRRVRARFALVAFVGQQACAAGLLPWNQQAAIEAAQSAYQAWLTRQNVDDTDRGVEAVRAFILANASRFQVGNTSPPRDRAGWYQDNAYHFTPEGFKEACNCADVQSVKKALNRQGYLKSNRVDAFSNVITVPDSDTKVSAYSVLETILGELNHD